MASYDIIGSIAVMKFDKENGKEKKRIALRLLKEHKNLKTILEKIEKIKGRLRTYKTKYLAGIKTKETIYTESGCKFKLDVEKCYFSPRLSNERLEVARKIKKNSKVLVMFSGVAPFSIVIGKISKAKVISVELNRKASRYAKENVKLNKLNNVEIIQGDVKKIIPRIKEKFDYVVMPRPQLKESFLKEAFLASKKGTKIFYYDFDKNPDEILEKIYLASKKAGKKIVVEKLKKAGEIAPYKFRWRVDLRVLN